MRRVAVTFAAGKGWVVPFLGQVGLKFLIRHMQGHVRDDGGIVEINSLDIPLQVDLEVCDPSWATKKDFVLTEAREPDTISNYIDWD